MTVYDDVWTKTGISPEELLAAAKKYKERAYAPYSKFHVGAAILFADGSIVGGCNVENASYGLSNCAERVAMGAAIASGHLNPVAVAVSGDSAFCSPCGACRQYLSEFNPRMEVVLMEEGEIKVFSLDSLLPHRFRLEWRKGEQTDVR